MRKKIVESTIMFIIVLKHKLLWFSPVWVLILPLQTTLIFLHTMQTHIAPRQDSISLALTNVLNQRCRYGVHLPQTKPH